ncbi:hypothetical protein [Neoroseomonas terrae]|uniref:hypothetical protein n=1 Tax=Neoroseomonas terrae TaxID=424799 RepID=UPI001BAA0869|nr:hypothetical protein [Neoroseomonas terrae]
MTRIVFLLVLLAAVGAGLAWLGSNPPPSRGVAMAPGAAPAPPPRSLPSVAPPTGGQAALATPFGDALFRWRCTLGLKDALGSRPDWPLERIAGLCLCAADRLREDGPRDIVLGTAEVAGALEAAEARICRRE